MVVFCLMLFFLHQHKYKTLNPTWLEMFDLRMYQGHTNTIEITVFDHDVGKDDFMGRYYTGLVATKPVFQASDNVRYKPVSSATETS